MWSDTSIESLAIQHTTDGLYSHCGLIHNDAQGNIYAMDVYPKHGLRYKRLEDYLKPEKNELVRVGLLRYKGNLDKQCIEDFVEELRRKKEDIKFDSKMIFEKDDLFLGDIQKLYCTELIYFIFKSCNMGASVIENDYGLIMKKWKNHKMRSWWDIVKRMYLKKHLGRLREADHKIVYTPNGIVRGGFFDILQEIKGPAESYDIMKELTSLADDSKKSKKKE